MSVFQLLLKPFVGLKSMKVRNITASELRILMQIEDDLTIVDIRPLNEVATGKIPGAVHLDVLKADFITQIPAFARERKVVVVCTNGTKSKVAAEYMQKIGFSNVYNLTDGMKYWVGALK